MDVGTVKQVDIDSEMRAAYLDYAMSVIISRALPDARDGLKPVHRRILYAMHDMGLRIETPYRKSARIVGEVLGKYHPHGDAAVYDAMVRMAQEFSMRCLLIDGQGNFGSIDGDSPAAMRYTEARMASAGFDMMVDIDKDTIDFVENFDGSLTEPVVLPSLIPNLLVNGSYGIAVGMSTSIPPHNLGEVCSALAYMLDNWDSLDNIGLPDLMEFIKGPDFPTGGVLFKYHRDAESDSLAQAYATGRGRVTLQARAHVEQLSRNRNRIVITELPYQVNKANLIERIADLHRDERLEGLTDLRDESDRQGMRIIIDLTRTVEPGQVLEQLYAMTPMRSTFSIIMLALVNGEPRLLTLKQALKVYLEHRFEIVKRRSEFDLARARERAHILEGYIIALDNLNEVIDTIRRSRTAESARQNLEKRFKLSELQATAVLNMPLRRLASLERRKIEDAYKELQKSIKYLEKLLGSSQALRDVVKEEVVAVSERYTEPRRTVIVDAASGDSIAVSELLQDESGWVVLTESGLISRSYDDEMPKVTQRVKDVPRLMFHANASDTVYLFTASGTAATIAVHQIPQSYDFEKGTHFTSVAPLDADAYVVAALTLPPIDETTQGYLVLVTEGGMVKRVDVQDLPGLSAREFQVIGLSGDALCWAEWTYGTNEIILVTAEGQAIRFEESSVRSMGLPAAGVKGVKLGGRHDKVVGAAVADLRQSLWVITNDGYAKSSGIDEYPVQGRYGQGVISVKFDHKKQLIVAAATGVMDDNLVVTTSKNKPKYMRFGLAPRAGRNTKGESIIALDENEQVMNVVVPRSYGFRIEEPQ